MMQGKEGLAEEKGMSFAEELAKNYGTKTINTKKDNEIRSLVENLIFTIKDECKKASGSARSIEGYYCMGPCDTPNYIGTAQKYAYKLFYEGHFGREEGAILKHHPGILAVNHADKVRMIQEIEAEVKTLGFRNFSICAEDYEEKVMVGYTEFLRRNKFKTVPAFRIYIKVQW